jgi:hypothetical protein
MGSAPVIDLTTEQTFATPRHEVRYLTRVGRAPRLLVVFSGFDAAGRQRYNYIRQLEGVAPHRMYVLDNLGERGCYYLGRDRDPFVADAVSQAIAAELERLGLGTDQLVTAGSSKGGSAALYFGLEFGCRILAGAPQYYIGDYLTNASAAVAVCKLIAGGSEPEDVEWLDGVLGRAIDGSAPGASVSLFSSPRDEQFESHIQPMIERLESAGVEHDLTLGTYAGHRAIGDEFGPWLRKQSRLISGEGALVHHAARLSARLRARRRG